MGEKFGDDAGDRKKWDALAKKIGCTDIVCDKKCPDGKTKVLILETASGEAPHAYRREKDGWSCKYGIGYVAYKISDPYADYEEAYKNYHKDPGGRRVEKCYCCP